MQDGIRICKVWDSTRSGFVKVPYGWRLGVAEVAFQPRASKTP